MMIRKIKKKKGAEIQNELDEKMEKIKEEETKSLEKIKKVESRNWINDRNSNK